MKTSEDTDSALQAAKEHTRTSAKNLRAIILRYSNNTQEKTSPASAKNIPKFRHENQALLRILQFIPPVLLAVFAGSFLWDFTGFTYNIFGYTFNFEGLLRILSISGLIGFCTNWIAITMLFKPIKKRPILGHGLIPAQKDRIAFRLAQAVSDDLINPDIIKQKIHESDSISRFREQSTRYIKSIIDDPAFRTELKAWVVDYVDDMIAKPEIRSAIAEKILIQIEKSLQQTSIEKVALKAYTFVKGQKMQQIVEESLGRLPESIESGLDRFDSLLDELPAHIDEHSKTIEQLVTSLLYTLVNKLDVHILVEDKLREYDEQRISDLIQNAANEQLQYIQYLGAILGVIGGFLIWEPFISIMVLAAIGLSIYLLDRLLMNV